MCSRFIFIIAIMLLFAFSAKVGLNIQPWFDDEKKAGITLSENDNTENEKAEKDSYKDQKDLIYYAAAFQQQAIVTDKASFLNRDEHPATPIHFLAVPTPPPWA